MTGPGKDDDLSIAGDEFSELVCLILAIFSNITRGSNGADIEKFGFVGVPGMPARYGIDGMTVVAGD